MRNRFDELAKQIGERALAPCGVTVPQHRISPENQFADLRHEPDPSRIAERARLGLLGRIAARPCLIETYSRAPSADDVRSCLVKHLAYWQDRKRVDEDAVPPDLWIVCAGVPKGLFASLGVEREDAWPTGIYRWAGEVLRVYFAIAAEVPRDPTTILVRLMAGGPLLAPAIRELAALPSHSYERTVADPVLLELRHLFERNADLLPEEKEAFMAAYQSLDDLREEGREQGREEGREQGRALGRLESHRSVLRKLLGIKFGTLPADVETHIASANESQLERYLERVVFADSLAAVLDSESR